MNTNTFFMKTVSMVVACIFTCTTIAFSAPPVSQGASHELTQSEKVSYKAPLAWRLNFSDEYAIVKSRWVATGNGPQTKKTPTVVIVQDAHCHFEAQMNIKNIIDSLLQHEDIQTKVSVGLEGAAGALDVSIFNHGNNLDVKDALIQYFVQHGKLSGAEYAAIVNNDKAQFFGVEEEELYFDNYQAFLEIIRFRGPLSEEMDKIDEVLSQLRTLLYSDELKAFEKEFLAFKAEEKTFFEYADTLLRQAEICEIDLFQYPNIAQYREVKEREGRIDFQTLQIEINQYLKSLMGKMDSRKDTEGMARIERFTTQYNQQKISNSDYFHYLVEQGFAHGVNLLAYKNLYEYTEYLKKFRRINKQQLRFERRELELKIKYNLVLAAEGDTSDAQIVMKLIELSERLHFLKNLIHTKIFNQDIDDFKRERDAFSAREYVRFIMSIAPRHGINPDLSLNIAYVDRIIPKVYDFYAASMERDTVMVDNLLVKTEGQECAAIVVGGFHTGGIQQELEKRSISYVIVAPKVTSREPQQETLYMKRMLGEADPLDLITLDVLNISNVRVDAYNMPVQQSVMANVINQFLAVVSFLSNMSRTSYGRELIRMQYALLQSMIEGLVEVMQSETSTLEDFQKALATVEEQFSQLTNNTVTLSLQTNPQQEADIAIGNELRQSRNVLSIDLIKKIAEGFASLSSKQSVSFGFVLNKDIVNLTLQKNEIENTDQTDIVSPNIADTGATEGHETVNTMIREGLMQIAQKQSITQDQQGRVDLAVDNENVFDIDGTRVIVLDNVDRRGFDGEGQQGHVGLREGVVYLTREAFAEYQSGQTNRLNHERAELALWRSLISRNADKLGKTFNQTLGYLRNRADIADIARRIHEKASEQFPVDIDVAPDHVSYSTFKGHEKAVAMTADKFERAWGEDVSEEDLNKAKQAITLIKEHLQKLDEQTAIDKGIVNEEVVNERGLERGESYRDINARGIFLRHDCWIRNGVVYEILKESGLFAETDIKFVHAGEQKGGYGYHAYTLVRLGNEWFVFDAAADQFEMDLEYSDDTGLVIMPEQLSNEVSYNNEGQATVYKGYRTQDINAEHRGEINEELTRIVQRGTTLSFSSLENQAEIAEQASQQTEDIVFEEQEPAWDLFADETPRQTEETQEIEMSADLLAELGDIGAQVETSDQAEKTEGIEMSPELLSMLGENNDDNAHDALSLQDIADLDAVRENFVDTLEESTKFQRHANIVLKGLQYKQDLAHIQGNEIVLDKDVSSLREELQRELEFVREENLRTNNAALERDIQRLEELAFILDAIIEKTMREEQLHRDFGKPENQALRQELLETVNSDALRQFDIEYPFYSQMSEERKKEEVVTKLLTDNYIGDLSAGSAIGQTYNRVVAIVTMRVVRATAWNDLLNNEMAAITGYSIEELERIIIASARDRKNLNYLTRQFGLRKQVQTLIDTIGTGELKQRRLLRAQERNNQKQEDSLQDVSTENQSDARLVKTVLAWVQNGRALYAHITGSYVSEDVWTERLNEGERRWQAASKKYHERFTENKRLRDEEYPGGLFASSGGWHYYVSDGLDTSRKIIRTYIDVDALGTFATNQKTPTDVFEDIRRALLARGLRGFQIKTIDVHTQRDMRKKKERQDKIVVYVNDSDIEALLEILQQYESNNQDVFSGQGISFGKMLLSQNGSAIQSVRVLEDTQRTQGITYNQFLENRVIETLKKFLEKEYQQIWMQYSANESITEADRVRLALKEVFARDISVLGKIESIMNDFAQNEHRTIDEAVSSSRLASSATTVIQENTGQEVSEIVDLDSILRDFQMSEPVSDENKEVQILSTAGPEYEALSRQEFLDLQKMAKGNNPVAQEIVRAFEVWKQANAQENVNTLPLFRTEGATIKYAYLNEKGEIDFAENLESVGNRMILSMLDASFSHESIRNSSVDFAELAFEASELEERVHSMVSQADKQKIAESFESLDENVRESIVEKFLEDYDYFGGKAAYEALTDEAARKRFRENVFNEIFAKWDYFPQDGSIVFGSYIGSSLLRYDVETGVVSRIVERIVSQNQRLGQQLSVLKEEVMLQRALRELQNDFVRKQKARTKAFEQRQQTRTFRDKLQEVDSGEEALALLSEVVDELQEEGNEALLQDSAFLEFLVDLMRVTKNRVHIFDLLKFKNSLEILSTLQEFMQDAYSGRVGELSLSQINLIGQVELAATTLREQTVQLRQAREAQEREAKALAEAQERGQDAAQGAERITSEEEAARKRRADDLLQAKTDPIDELYSRVDLERILQEGSSAYTEKINSFIERRTLSTSLIREILFELYNNGLLPGDLSYLLFADKTQITNEKVLQEISQSKEDLHNAINSALQDMVRDATRKKKGDFTIGYAQLMEKTLEVLQSKTKAKIDKDAATTVLINEKFSHHIRREVISTTIQEALAREIIDTKFQNERNNLISEMVESALSQITLSDEATQVIETAREKYKNAMDAYDEGETKPNKTLFDTIWEEAQNNESVKQELFGDRDEKKEDMTIQGSLYEAFEGTRVKRIVEEYDSQGNVTKEVERLEVFDENGNFLQGEGGLLRKRLEEAREFVRENGTHDLDRSIMPALAAGAMALRIGNGYYHYAVQSDAAMRVGSGYNLQASTGFGKTETIIPSAALYWVLDVGKIDILVTDGYFVYNDHMKRKKAFDAMGLASNAVGENCRDPRTQGQSFDRDKQKHMYEANFDILTTTASEQAFNFEGQQKETNDQYRYLTGRKSRGVAIVDEQDYVMIDLLNSRNIIADQAKRLTASEYAVVELADEIARSMINSKDGAEIRIIYDEGEEVATIEQESAGAPDFTYNVAQGNVTVQQSGRAKVEAFRKRAYAAAEKTDNEALKTFLNDTTRFHERVKQALVANKLKEENTTHYTNHETGEVVLIDAQGTKLVQKGQRSQGDLGIQLDYVVARRQQQQVEKLRSTETPHVEKQAFLQELVNQGLLPKEFAHIALDEVLSQEQIDKLTVDAEQTAKSDKTVYKLPVTKAIERGVISPDELHEKTWTLADLITQFIVLQPVFVKSNSRTTNETTVRNVTMDLHKIVVGVSGTNDEDRLKLEMEREKWGELNRGTSVAQDNTLSKKRIGKAIIVENEKALFDEWTNILINQLTTIHGAPYAFDFLDKNQLERFVEYVYSREDAVDVLAREGYDFERLTGELTESEKSEVLERSGFRTILGSTIFQRGSEVGLAFDGGDALQIMGKLNKARIALQEQAKRVGIEQLESEDDFKQLQKAVEALVGEEYFNEQKRAIAIAAVRSYFTSLQKSIANHAQTLSATAKEQFKKHQNLNAGARTLFVELARMYRATNALNGFISKSTTIREKQLENLCTGLGIGEEASTLSERLAALENYLGSEDYVQSQELIATYNALSDMYDKAMVRLVFGLDYYARSTQNRLDKQKAGRPGRNGAPGQITFCYEMAKPESDKAMTHDTRTVMEGLTDKLYGLKRTEKEYQKYIETLDERKQVKEKLNDGSLNDSERAALEAELGRLEAELIRIQQLALTFRDNGLAEQREKGTFYDDIQKVINDALCEQYRKNFQTETRDEQAEDEFDYENFTQMIIHKLFQETVVEAKGERDAAILAFSKRLSYIFGGEAVTEEQAALLAERTDAEVVEKFIQVTQERNVRPMLEDLAKDMLTGTVGVERIEAVKTMKRMINQRYGGKQLTGDIAERIATLSDADIIEALQNMVNVEQKERTNQVVADHVKDYFDTKFDEFYETDKNLRSRYNSFFDPKIKWLENKASFMGEAGERFVKRLAQRISRVFIGWRYKANLKKFQKENFEKVEKNVLDFVLDKSTKSEENANLLPGDIDVLSATEFKEVERTQREEKQRKIQKEREQKAREEAAKFQWQKKWDAFWRARAEKKRKKRAIKEKIVSDRQIVGATILPSEAQPLEAREAHVMPLEARIDRKKQAEREAEEEIEVAAIDWQAVIDESFAASEDLPAIEKTTPRERFQKHQQADYTLDNDQVMRLKGVHEAPLYRVITDMYEPDDPEAQSSPQRVFVISGTWNTADEEEKIKQGLASIEAQPLEATEREVLIIGNVASDGTPTDIVRVRFSSGEAEWMGEEVARLEGLGKEIAEDDIARLVSFNGHVPVEAAQFRPEHRKEMKRAELFAWGDKQFLRLTADEPNANGIRETRVQEITNRHADNIRELVEDINSKDTFFVTNDFVVVEGASFGEAKDKVAQDANVSFGVVLRGESKIEAGATVEAAILEDTTVKRGDSVEDGARLKNVRVKGRIAVGRNSVLDTIYIEETSQSAGDCIVARDSFIENLALRANLQAGEGSRLEYVEASSDVTLGAYAIAELLEAAPGEAITVASEEMFAGTVGPFSKKPSMPKKAVKAPYAPEEFMFAEKSTLSKIKEAFAQQKAKKQEGMFGMMQRFMPKNMIGTLLGTGVALYLKFIAGVLTGPLGVVGTIAIPLAFGFGFQFASKLIQIGKNRYKNFIDVRTKEFRQNIRQKALLGQQEVNEIITAIEMQYNQVRALEDERQESEFAIEKLTHEMNDKAYRGEAIEELRTARTEAEEAKNDLDKEIAAIFKSMLSTIERIRSTIIDKDIRVQLGAYAIVARYETGSKDKAFENARSLLENAGAELKKYNQALYEDIVIIAARGLEKPPAREQQLDPQMAQFMKAQGLPMPRQKPQAEAHALKYFNLVFSHAVPVATTNTELAEILNRLEVKRAEAQTKEKKTYRQKLQDVPTRVMQVVSGISYATLGVAILSGVLMIVAYFVAPVAFVAPVLASVLKYNLGIATGGLVLYFTTPLVQTLMRDRERKTISRELDQAMGSFKEQDITLDNLHVFENYASGLIASNPSDPQITQLLNRLVNIINNSQSSEDEEAVREAFIMYAVFNRLLKQLANERNRKRVRGEQVEAIVDPYSMHKKINDHASFLWNEAEHVFREENIAIGKEEGAKLAEQEALQKERKRLFDQAAEKMNEGTIEYFDSLDKKYGPKEYVEIVRAYKAAFVQHADDSDALDAHIARFGQFLSKVTQKIQEINARELREEAQEDELLRDVATQELRNELNTLFNETTNTDIIRVIFKNLLTSGVVRTVLFQEGNVDPITKLFSRFKSMPEATIDGLVDIIDEYNKSVVPNLQKVTRSNMAPMVRQIETLENSPFVKEYPALRSVLSQTRLTIESRLAQEERSGTADYVDAMLAKSRITDRIENNEFSSAERMQLAQENGEIEQEQNKLRQSSVSHMLKQIDETKATIRSVPIFRNDLFGQALLAEAKTMLHAFEYLFAQGWMTGEFNRALMAKARQVERKLLETKENDQELAEEVHQLLGRLNYLKGRYYERIGLVLNAKESYKLVMTYNKKLAEAHHLNYRIGLLNYELGYLDQAVQFFNDEKDFSFITKTERARIEMIYIEYFDKTIRLEDYSRARKTWERIVSVFHDNKPTQELLEKKEALLLAQRKTYQQKTESAIQIQKALHAQHERADKKLKEALPEVPKIEFVTVFIEGTQEVLAKEFVSDFVHNERALADLYLEMSSTNEEYLDKAKVIYNDLEKLDEAKDEARVGSALIAARRGASDAFSQVKNVKSKDLQATINEIRIRSLLTEATPKAFEQALSLLGNEATSDVSTMDKQFKAYLVETLQKEREQGFGRFSEKNRARVKVQLLEVLDRLLDASLNKVDNQLMIIDAGIENNEYEKALQLIQTSMKLVREVAKTPYAELPVEKTRMFHEYRDILAERMIRLFEEQHEATPDSKEANKRLAENAQKVLSFIIQNGNREDVNRLTAEAINKTTRFGQMLKTQRDMFNQQEIAREQAQKEQALGTPREQLAKALKLIEQAEFNDLRNATEIINRIFADDGLWQRYQGTFIPVVAYMIGAYTSEDQISPFAFASRPLEEQVQVLQKRASNLGLSSEISAVVIEWYKNTQGRAASISEEGKSRLFQNAAQALTTQLKISQTEQIAVLAKGFSYEDVFNVQAAEQDLRQDDAFYTMISQARDVISERLATVELPSDIDVVELITTVGMMPVRLFDSQVKNEDVYLHGYARDNVIVLSRQMLQKFSGQPDAVAEYLFTLMAQLLVTQYETNAIRAMQRTLFSENYGSNYNIIARTIREINSELVPQKLAEESVKETSTIPMVASRETFNRIERKAGSILLETNASSKALHELISADVMQEDGLNSNDRHELVSLITVLSDDIAITSRKFDTVSEMRDGSWIENMHLANLDALEQGLHVKFNLDLLIKLFTIDPELGEKQIRDFASVYQKIKNGITIDFFSSDIEAVKDIIARMKANGIDIQESTVGLRDTMQFNEGDVVVVPQSMANQYEQYKQQGVYICPVDQDALLFGEEQGLVSILSLEVLLMRIANFLADPTAYALEDAKDLTLDFANPIYLRATDAVIDQIQSTQFRVAA